MRQSLPFVDCPRTLLLIWADWCPYCTSMIEEWRAFAAAHASDAGILALDVESKALPAFQCIAPELAALKGSFPTIALVAKGRKPVLYDGPRTAAALTAFAKSRTHQAPPSKSTTAKKRAPAKTAKKVGGACRGA